MEKKEPTKYLLNLTPNKRIAPKSENYKKGFEWIKKYKSFKYSNKTNNKNNKKTANKSKIECQTTLKNSAEEFQIKLKLQKKEQQ